MDYKYDVFVSYKRSELWDDWVKDNFLPMLTSHLELRLGHKPRIFYDVRMPAGTDWPEELAHALTSSCVLVPLFSAGYFQSECCVRELYAMRHKEKQSNLRTPDQRRGIIAPAWLHGTSVDLPPDFAENYRTQAADLTPFMLQTLKIGLGELYQRFEIKIRDWVETSILPAIDIAPKLEQAWYDEIRQEKFDCPRPVKFHSICPSLAYRKS